MRKTLLWFIKAGIAGIIACGIVNGICFFYYNVPVHHKSPSESSDYIWDSDTFVSHGNEGFATTKTDENGYINTYPQKGEQNNILILGSSHTEGFNVNSDENYTYLLNKKLSDGGNNIFAYNIGISGHTLVKCIRNMQAAVIEFKPTDYIIIETYGTEIDYQSLESFYNGTLNYIESHDSGIIAALQRIDLFRLLYKQVESYTKNINKNDSDDFKPYVKAEEKTEESYEFYLSHMLEKASETAKENGLKLIIFSHGVVSFDYNGKILHTQPTQKQILFRKLCEKHGIILIDMQTPFYELYENENILPNGFSNTDIGVGHINKYAHKIIADSLYERIIKEEKK